jgi:nitrogenase molybdenum-iron protein NifN
MTISGQHQVPKRLERQRGQLQDALLDTHFMLGQLRIALAADADLLAAWVDLLQETGAEIVSAVTSCTTPSLAKIPLSHIKIGDLEDLEISAKSNRAQVLIGNSHAVASAERLQIPILRAGFPLYDWIGGYAQTWIGYQGSRQTLFQLANLVSHQAHQAIPVYRSLYSQKSATEMPSQPSCH